MKEIMIKIGKFILRHIIDCIITAGIGTLVGICLNEFTTITENIIVLIVLSAAVIILVIINIIREMAIIPNMKWDEDVKHDIYTLRLTGADTAEFSKCTTFVPCVNDSVLFFGAYDWNDCTEVTNVEFECVYSKINIIQAIDNDGVIHNGEYNFQEILPINYKSMRYNIVCPVQSLTAEKEIKCKVSMKYEQATFNKELYVVVRRPLKKLTLNLAVSENIHVSNVHFEAVTDMGHQKQIKKRKDLSAENQINDNGIHENVYAHTIYRPKMFCKYIIRWDWQ